LGRFGVFTLDFQLVEGHSYVAESYSVIEVNE